MVNMLTCPGRTSTGVIDIMAAFHLGVPVLWPWLLRMLAHELDSLWHFSGTEPSLLLLVTPVLFLLWQFKMSAVRKTNLTYEQCDLLGNTFNHFLSELHATVDDTLVSVCYETTASIILYSVVYVGHVELQWLISLVCHCLRRGIMLTQIRRKNNNKKYSLSRNNNHIRSYIRTTFYQRNCPYENGSLYVLWITVTWTLFLERDIAVEFLKCKFSLL